MIAEFYPSLYDLLPLDSCQSWVKFFSQSFLPYSAELNLFGRKFV